MARCQDSIPGLRCDNRKLHIPFWAFSSSVCLGYKISTKTKSEVSINYEISLTDLWIMLLQYFDCRDGLRQTQGGNKIVDEFLLPSQKKKKKQDCFWGIDSKTEVRLSLENLPVDLPRLLKEIDPNDPLRLWRIEVVICAFFWILGCHVIVHYCTLVM